jgi:hypothetical protein
MVRQRTTGFSLTVPKQTPVIRRVRPSGPLTLTTSRPIGYDPGESPPAGVPVFVTWGTVGGLFSDDALFTTPIGYVTAAGTRYVWAKVGLSSTAVLAATSLAFVTSTSPTGFATANFAEDGTPPEFMYIPLGRIVSLGSGDDVVVTLNSAGSGSIVVAMHIANVTTTEGGVINALTRHLTYWRTNNA